VDLAVGGGWAPEVHGSWADVGVRPGKFKRCFGEGSGKAGSRTTSMAGKSSLWSGVTVKPRMQLPEERKGDGPAVCEAMSEEQLRYPAAELDCLFDGNGAVRRSSFCKVMTRRPR